MPYPLRPMNRSALLMLCRLALIGLSSCAAMNIPVRLTYQAVDEVPLENGNVVALATGETLDVSNILANESKRPSTLLVHKIEGVYVLVGEGFKNLYVLNPKGETADVDFVPLLSVINGATEPKMRPGVASRCTLLTYKTTQGAEQKLFIGSEGKTSPSDCPDKKEI
jgi:hypothetical protein